MQQVHPQQVPPPGYAFETETGELRPIRSLGLSFEFWLWPWDFSAGRDADRHGGFLWLSVGPLCLKLNYGRP